MQFKYLDEIDIKLYLLSGSEMMVDNLIVEPYTIDEIRKYGYSNYMSNLKLLTAVTIDDFITSVLDMEKRISLEEQRSNLKVFDFYIKLGGKELLDNLVVILAMIFKTNDIRMWDEKSVIIDLGKTGVFIENEDGDTVLDEEKVASLGIEDLKIVNRDNFDELIEIVKIQNYLSNPNKDNKQGSNPADEETKKLMEQMERNRQRVESAKKVQQTSDDKDEEIDISDIISAVTAKSFSINKINVWEHTLYQLYDEYSRLELIDNYDFSIKAMMAGAEKIDLKHWSSKI